MTKLIFEDNHIHSTYSDGHKTLAQIFEYNHYYDKLDITITDHVDKNTKWFEQYAQKIKNLRKKYKDFSAKIGCEVKIIDGSAELNTTRQILKMAEIVVGSVHHFPNIKSLSAHELIQKEYELTKLLAANDQINILGHPFSMAKRFFDADPPLKYVKDVYDTCVKNGIKFEYNKKNSPPNVKRLVYQEVLLGHIKNFSFGSDMHDNLRELGSSALDVAPTISILVTGAGAGVGQSIIKSIKLSKLKTRLVTADHSHLAAGNYRADAAYLVPLAGEKNYVRRIVDICKKEKINIIFPGTDVELETLALNKKKIESATRAKLIISSLKAVRTADDKWQTVNFLKNNRHPYPKSWLGITGHNMPGGAKFPLVVKPRVGARSIGFSIINNAKEFDEKIRLIKNPIIQEYLPQDNKEYTCGAFFYKGKNYGIITAKRWLRNGDTYKAIFRHDKELENFIARVGKKLNIFGPCNFQLRKTRKGPTIFEINCRFSGTSGAASFLGFNVANALMQTVCLGRPPKKLSFKEAYMFRYWNEIFTNLKQVKKLETAKYVIEPLSQLNEF